MVRQVNEKQQKSSDAYHCTVIGQVKWINLDKSMIHFSTNTPRNIKQLVCQTLNMKECNHSGTYLGNPFCSFKSKSEAFGAVMTKLEGKLQGGKRNLSLKLDA